MARSSVGLTDIVTSRTGPVSIVGNSAVEKSSDPYMFFRRISVWVIPSRRATTFSIRSLTQVSLAHGPR